MIIALLAYALACGIACMVGSMVLLGLVRTMLGESPFVRTAQSICNTLAQEVVLPPGSILYDLGAGDGRVVRAMARANPASTCIGVELRYFPYLLGRLLLLLTRQKKVTLVRKDIFTVSVADATHVYLYLFPKVIERLFPLLVQQLRPGTILVSCDFPYTALAPDRTVTVGTGLRKHTLYTYNIKEAQKPNL